jgi:hypothetical protein
MAVIFEVFFCKYTLFSVDFVKPLYNAQTLGAKKATQSLGQLFC